MGGGFPMQTGKYYQASNGEQLRPMYASLLRLMRRQ